MGFLDFIIAEVNFLQLCSGNSILSLIQRQIFLACFLPFPSHELASFHVIFQSSHFANIRVIFGKVLNYISSSAVYEDRQIVRIAACDFATSNWLH